MIRANVRRAACTPRMPTKRSFVRKYHSEMNRKLKISDEVLKFEPLIREHRVSFVKHDTYGFDVYRKDKDPYRDPRHFKCHTMDIYVAHNNCKVLAASINSIFDYDNLKSKSCHVNVSGKVNFTPFEGLTEFLKTKYEKIGTADENYEFSDLAYVIEENHCLKERETIVSETNETFRINYAEHIKGARRYNLPKIEHVNVSRLKNYYATAQNLSVNIYRLLHQCIPNFKKVFMYNRLS